METYTIGFDFTSSAQQAVLSKLQQQGYGLLVFQSIGDLENAQQTPIWLLMPFNDIFGVFTLPFTPQYKVYVAHNDVLGIERARALTNGVGDSFAMSNVVPLGTSLVFNQKDGFTIGTQRVPADAITLQNAATTSGQELTAGLAASINGSYRPFSAASVPPTFVVEMTPRRNLIFGVAHFSTANGKTVVNSFGTGAQIELDPTQGFTYTLSIEAETYAVVSTGSTSSMPVSSQAMEQLAIGS